LATSAEGSDKTIHRLFLLASTPSFFVADVYSQSHKNLFSSVTDAPDNQATDVFPARAVSAESNICGYLPLQWGAVVYALALLANKRWELKGLLAVAYLYEVKLKSLCFGSIEIRLECR
jgi:hypothetical protein